MLKDPKVLFAGYRVTHPLENKISLRVQTTTDYTPQEAFKEAIRSLIRELDTIGDRFGAVLSERMEGLDN